MNFITRNRATFITIGKILAFGALIVGTTGLVDIFAALSAPSTAAFSFLIIVLLSAYFGNLLVAVITSIVATLCFDVFFLPPVGTFHIAAFSDWISLLAFLVASVMISALTASAAEQAANARELKNAMLQLRTFAEWLLVTPSDQFTLSGIAVEALRIFSLEYCSIHVLRDGIWNHFSGSAESRISAEVKDRLKRVQDHPTQFMDFANETVLGVQYMQIKKGMAPQALLAIKSSSLPSEAIGAMAYMIGARLDTITNKQ